MIEQTGSLLRPHKVEVALFDHNADGTPSYRSSIIVDVNVCDLLLALLSHFHKGDKTAVPALVGQKAPAAVYINYNDHAYAKVTLDPVSLEYFKNNVEKFQDTLFRQLIWSSFANMLRDAQYPAQEFLRLIKEYIRYVLFTSC